MSATLVQFAGDDQKPRRLKPSAYSLFQLGHDTVEIAKRLGITEAAASRQLHEQRSAELGFPVEYERRCRS